MTAPLESLYSLTQSAFGTHGNQFIRTGKEAAMSAVVAVRALLAFPLIANI
jgi:hypothetical protein